MPETSINFALSLDVFDEFDDGTMLSQVLKSILDVYVGDGHLGLGLNCACNVLEANDVLDGPKRTL